MLKKLLKLMKSSRSKDVSMVKVNAILNMTTKGYKRVEE